MKLQNIYKRNSIILSYTNKRIYTLSILINLKGVVAEYLKLRDKTYCIFNNFSSFLRSNFLKNQIVKKF